LEACFLEEAYLGSMEVGSLEVVWQMALHVLVASVEALVEVVLALVACHYLAWVASALCRNLFACWQKRQLLK